MAYVYKGLNGKKITEIIALNDGVQAELEARTFEIAVRAEEMLLEHRQEGHAAIEIDHGDVDWYVVLSDERGQKAAMSIEYGREPYTDEETGEEKGRMDGLFILQRAAHLARKKKARVKL